MAQLEKGVQSVSIEDNLAWKVWALLLFHYIDASVDTSKVMSSYFVRTRHGGFKLLSDDLQYALRTHRTGSSDYREAI